MLKEMRSQTNRKTDCQTCSLRLTGILLALGNQQINSEHISGSFILLMLKIIQHYCFHGNWYSGP